MGGAGALFSILGQHFNPTVERVITDAGEYVHTASTHGGVSARLVFQEAAMYTAVGAVLGAAVNLYRGVRHNSWVDKLEAQAATQPEVPPQR